MRAQKTPMAAMLVASDLQLDLFLIGEVQEGQA